MKFSKNMNVGDVLQIIGLAVGLISLWANLDKSMAVVTTQNAMIITRVDRLENMLFRTNQFTLNEDITHGKKAF